MNHPVIPIHNEDACEGRSPLSVLEPVFEGDAAVLQRVVAALKPQVDRAFEADVPTGGWLRGLRIDAGDARMQLAPDLGCRGFIVATLAFDTMRRLLPDTDIFVGTAEEH
jgi:hypothetical protein